MSLPTGFTIVKKGKIRKGDKLLIMGKWWEAIGSIGSTIGSQPWHRIGDVIRRRPAKAVEARSKNSTQQPQAKT
jgi:hypothetical protein